MEELIGKFWDRWITRKTATEFATATVYLSDIQSELTWYFRAMGGESGKVVEAAEKRKIRSQRTHWQRLAGSHQQFYLPWLDERSVRLPPQLSVFPDAELNETLYFWWAAMAAYLAQSNGGFRDNQAAIMTLTDRYGGLRKTYLQLVEAALAVRPELASLPLDLQAKELAVRQAMREPGSVSQLPVARHEVMPVCLWLYPSPGQCVSVAAEDDSDVAAGRKPSRAKPVKHLKLRKQAQRIDDERKTDGLLVFQPDSLPSWTEQVNLDRCQDEDDDDVAPIVNDSDVITLSRQRRATAAKVKFDLDLPAAENDELYLGEGIRLPEWHYRQARLVPDVCLLQLMQADKALPIPLPPHLQPISREVKQLVSRLGLTRRRLHAQSDGAELDLDAWLDSYTRPLRDLGKQNFYIDQQVDYRDFSCLILADLSLSTEGYVNDEKQVIDVIRDSLLIFSEALNQLNDAFAIYGFSSVRRTHVRYHLLKQFAEPFGPQVRGRIAQCKPGFYTRMGAAIRQSTRLLQQRPEAHRVLLMLSDGKPNDLDQYEGRYGLEDTRQAILEARKAGVTPYCVTVDPEGHDYLPYLFGRDSFAVVTEHEQLPRVLPRVYLNLSTH